MNDSRTQTAETPPVFQHHKRTDWGIAALAWESDEKRGYLFSDGELRILARPYYDLMREVVRPREEVEPLLMDLARVTGEPAPARSPRTASVRFEDQLRYFLARYPDGFSSKTWQEERRGKGAARRLKRHRDAAVDQARALLARDVVDAKLSEHRHAELLEDLRSAAKGTDLISTKCLTAIATNDPTRLAELAKSLRHVLYGEGAFEQRFQRWLDAIHHAYGKNPSWQLATVAAALVFPGEHVSVQPAGFRELARSTMPRLARVRPPVANLYLQFQELARYVQKKLSEAQVPPGDLLDVSDFIRLTTTPSARKAMLTSKHDASGSPSPGESAEAA